jgi:hypothetical protein
LKRELARIADAQKTPREHVDLSQVQLAFAAFEKQLLEVVRAQPAQDPPATDAPAPAGGSGGSGKRPPKRTPHGRGVLPESLPVRTLILSPKNLPDDAVIIGEEVSWRLGVLPTRFIRIKIVRPLIVVSKGQAPQGDEITVQSHEGNVSSIVRPAPDRPRAEPGAPAPLAVAPPDASAVVAPEGSSAEAPCSGSLADSTIVCAAMPLEMIPRGLPSPELLALILTAKFADKSPFNRQEGIYARSGVHITRGTMCGWAEQSHELARHVVDAMCDEAKATAHFIATDATGVLVLANERCKKGHFWVFVADRDHVFFRYSPRHSSEEPKSFFKGFKGTVIADASNVYDALFRDPDGPDEAGCNSHARRYFYKALASDRERALVGVGFFNRLFELERAFAGLPPSQRLALRKEKSAPVVHKLEQWRDAELRSPGVADGTPIRRALQYIRNHWDALTRFLHDGKIPIHNNWSELELRRLVIGRANWLFVGSDESAEWTCTFVSLVASCQLQGLDPQAYLRDLFRVLPSWPRSRVLELAPKYWRATRARLDPDELALPIGPLAVPPVVSGAQSDVVPAASDASGPPADPNG